jgi:capsid protein
MAYIPSHELESMLQPTKLDRAIASVFPGWGSRRMRSRREYAYEAAVNTRLRTTATRLQGPEDYMAFPDRLQLIRQVRDLEQNFGLFQSIIDKLAMYAFGRIRYQARTGDKERDDEYEAYLDDCFANCDLSGRHTLRDMVAIAFKSQLRDGDYALKWQRDPAGLLKLTGIEGDRLGGIYMQSADETYFQGIIIDPATGAPMVYRIFYRTKANSYTNPVDAPAQDIIHLFDPRRYDQYRGVTPFAPVINEARDLKELMEALRIGTKFENYHSAVVYTANGLPLNDPASFITGTETVNGAPTTEQALKYGLMQHAPIGSKVEWLDSSRPAGTLQTYMESLIRLMGTALNLPYGFLYNLSGLGGPSARMDSQQAQRTIQLHQENTKSRALNRIKDTYLMEGFARGKIRYTPNWRNGVWQFPPWPTIDAGRDSNAGINEWRAGLLSKSAWFAELGEDAEEQEAIIVSEADRTITTAKAMAKAHDVPIEVILTLLESKTPNGWLIKSNFEAPAYEPDPAPDAAAPAAEMHTVKITHDFSVARTEPPLAVPVAAPIPPLRELAADQTVRSHLEKMRSAVASSMSKVRSRTILNANPLDPDAN